MGGGGSVGEKEAKIGAGRWAEGRRVVVAVHLVGVRVLVVGARVLQAYLCERILTSNCCVWVAAYGGGSVVEEEACVCENRRTINCCVWVAAYATCHI